MHNRKEQLSPEEKSLYFDLQADFGITKHLGGLKATRELVELCNVEKGKYILEVGCGIGTTPCYIAERYGSRVVGVDISERMIERSKERAKRKGLEGKIEFRVADAQNLPFQDGLFDVVIGESITAFVKDKQRAVSEYVRVAKPGGYLGLNEATWVKAPPPELVKYIYLIMAKADFLTSKGWKELLEGSGLRDIEVRNYKFDARSQYIEEIRGLDVREYARAWYRFLTQSFTNPAYRRFAKDVFSTPKNIFKFMDHIGYGIYVGRK